MVHLPSTELTRNDRQALLELARQAIAVELGAVEYALPVEQPRALAQRRGVFVTLTRDGALRGCIGTLERDQPMVDSVPDCARGAAFRDPRFAPLVRSELAQVCVEISVLTEPEPLSVASRDELLETLRPGIDGLLIEEDVQRATFLPQVWEQLAGAEEFLGRLLAKAGLPGDYWSSRLRCSRYQCIKFSEDMNP